MFKKFVFLMLLTCLLQACNKSAKYPSLSPNTSTPVVNVSQAKATVTIFPQSTNAAPSNTETLTSTPLPSVTPDLRELIKGVRLVFSQKNQLWLWSNGTKISLAEITGNKQIWISDDGNYVAYNTERIIDELGFFDLWVTDSQGNKKKLLDAKTFKTMASPGLGLEWPEVDIDWIPNSHIMLINDFDRGRLYEINAETGDSRKIQQFSKPGYMHVSPDGNSILIISTDELFVYNLSTKKTKRLMQFPRISSVTGQPNYLHPIWKPDSKSFRIAIPITDIGVSDPRTGLWEVDLQTGKTKRLLDVNTAYTLVNFSPYGTWISYTKRLVSESDNPSELHLLNLEDKSDQAIMTGNIRINSWSPDEQKVSIVVLDNGLTLDNIITVGKEPVIKTLDQGSSFVTWIDSDRYFTSTGKIRSISMKGYISVIDKYQFDPLDFVVISQ
jgi:tricorn protease-like protein